MLLSMIPSHLHSPNPVQAGAGSLGSILLQLHIGAQGWLIAGGEWKLRMLKWDVVYSITLSNLNKRSPEGYFYVISFSLLILNDPVIFMDNRLYRDVPYGNGAEDYCRRDVGITTAHLATDPVGRRTMVKRITSYAHASGVCWQGAYQILLS